MILHLEIYIFSVLLLSFYPHTLADLKSKEVTVNDDGPGFTVGWES